MPERKKEPQTLQAKFGFQDSDLKTPKHDEIMMWLDSHIDAVVARLLGYAPEWRWNPKYIVETKERVARGIENRRIALRDEITRLQGELDSLPENQYYRQTRLVNQIQEMRNELQLIPDALPELPEPPCGTLYEITEKTWELPILSGKYTVGFVDMYTRVAHDSGLYVAGCIEEQLAGKTTVKLTDGLRWETAFHAATSFAFEVKPTIPSLGELIRQIRFYQIYQERWTYVVVSADTRWIEQLKSQNIRLVVYPGQ